MEKQRKLTSFFWKQRESAGEGSNVTDEAMVNTIMFPDSTEEPIPSTSSSDFDGGSSVAKGGTSPDFRLIDDEAKTMTVFPTQEKFIRGRS